MPCHQVPLPKRRALAIRLLTAIEVEAMPALRRDQRSLDVRSAFISFLVGQSNRVAVEPVESVQAACDEVARQIGEWAFHCDPPVRSQFEKARDRIVFRLSESRCESCGARATSERGEGPCLAGIVQLAAVVEQRIQGVYASHGALGAHGAASLVLESTLRGADCALLHECHLDGWTDVRQRPYGAEVGLALEDNQLDWRVLCQCLYVFTHEFACHAYQGSGAADRQNADAVCSWSDGWMDAFAWQQLERWLDVDIQMLPDWLRQDPESVKEHCRDLHQRRYKGRHGPLLTEVRLQRRLNARRGYQSLRRLYREARSAARNAARAADRFSVQFNVDAVDAELRDEISALLESGLYLDDVVPSFRAMQVARCCEAYSRHRDAGALARDLRRAIGPEKGLQALLEP